MKQHPDGSQGRAYRLEIVRKLETLGGEAAPGRLEKPIPPPPMEARKRRGGKRARRQKELVAMTQTRKLQNRLAFGQAETEVLVGSSVVGMGMLSRGSAAAGALRLPPPEERGREALKKQGQKATGIFGSDGSFSLPALPAVTEAKKPAETSKYFSKTASFKK